MKKNQILKKLGEKVATNSIQPMCAPFFFYQPTPPAKLLKEMKQK